MSPTAKPSSWRYDYTSLLPDSHRHLLNRASCPPPRLARTGCLLAAVLLVTYAIGGNDTAQYTTSSYPTTSDASLEDATRPLFLSLLVPGGKKHDLETCRSILSAQVLNYPIPQLIPLDQGLVLDKTYAQAEIRAPTGQKPKLPRPSSTARIWLDANLRWLSRAPPEGKDGIVILLDQPGVYFQLRPQVLLARYYRILREADEKASQRRSQDFATKAIQHSIVFPATESCSLAGSKEGDALCKAAPKPDARYLGQGYMMGPVKDIRLLITRAIAKLKDDPSENLQNVFATFYSEQSLHRTSKDPTASFVLTADPELGITLDHAHLLSASLDNPGAWHNLATTPAEIADTPPPYWTVLGSEPTLPHNETWSSIPLFHPSSSKSTLPPPAMLHHPSTTNTTLRTLTWTSLFYHPHARALYSASQHLPSTILASLSVLSPNGKHRLGEKTFWNRKALGDTAGAFSGGQVRGIQKGDPLEEEFWPWRAICGGKGESEGVLGDGKGPWVGGRFN